MKIEKCPFCGKQIAEIGNCKNMEECEHFEECPAVEPYVCVVCSINKGGCGASTGYQEGVEKAIAAWNRRANPENKLLTLEELREMGELPLWVLPNDEEALWCVWDGACAEIPGVDYWRWELKDYGKTWIAYRRPLERSEG
jgi:hypothetical protein